MIHVEAMDRESEADVARVASMLNNEVVPLVIQKFGSDFLLPDRLVVVPPMVALGRNEVTMDHDGTVTSLTMVMVRRGLSDRMLRWVLTHELGHHHELVTRMQRKIGFSNQAESILWSEYFAERVANKCEVTVAFSDLEEECSSDANYGIGSDSVQAGIGIIGVLPQYLVWTIAKVDSGIEWDGVWPVGLYHIISTLSNWKCLNTAFETFPVWTEEQWVDVALFLGTLQSR